MPETSRRRQPGETVFAFILLALGAFVVWEGFRIDGLYSPSSAGVFPALAGGIMVASAIGVILRNRRMAPAHIPEGSGAAREFLRRTTPLDVTVLGLLMLGYMLVLEAIGFLIASFAFLFLSIRYLHRGSWLLTLLVTLGALASVYIVFRVVFTVVLPTGWVFS